MLLKTIEMIWRNIFEFYKFIAKLKIIKNKDVDVTHSCRYSVRSWDFKQDFLEINSFFKSIFEYI